MRLMRYVPIITSAVASRTILILIHNQMQHIPQGLQWWLLSLLLLCYYHVTPPGCRDKQ